jgi:hypothetical protein
MNCLSHGTARLVLDVIPFHVEDRYHRCRGTCSCVNVQAGRVVCETKGCPDIWSGDRKGL